MGAKEAKAVYDKAYYRANKEKRTKQISTYRESYLLTLDGWLSGVTGDMKRRAKVRNLEMSVNKEYLKTLIVDKCPYTNLKLVRNIGKQGPDSISFDRIDNSKGYVKDNIQCVSLSYNAKKWTR